MVDGDLDIEALQLMLKGYTELSDNPELRQRVERQETMKLLMENAASEFSFSVQSNGYVCSKFYFYKLIFHFSPRSTCLLQVICLSAQLLKQLQKAWARCLSY